MRSGLRMSWMPLLAVALLAGACSSDGDGDVAAEATEAAIDEPSAEATAETAEESSDDPTAETTEEPTEEPTEEAIPEDLPASFRGVTEDTIKVGVVAPDWEALQAAGIPNYHGDTEIAFQTFFDQINAEGGIYGRQIEPVYASFDWLAPVTQEEACIKLTQDEEVFIALYGLLSQNNLCFTDLNDTMVITRANINAGLREASGDTLWLSLTAADDARAEIMATVLAEAGKLDGKTIGIIAVDTVGEGGDAKVLNATLDELGFEAELVLMPAFGDDAVARENEVAIVSQAFLADGIDFVFDLTGGGFTPGVMAREGFTPEFAFKELSGAVNGVEDPTLLDGAISVAELNEQSIFDDPVFWESCMRPVLDAHPELAPELEYIPDGDQQAEGEPNWLHPIMVACDQTRLLKAIGELVGAELTNETFRAALDDLGTFELLGYGQASFNSQSKWDGLDEFYMQVYDSDSASIMIEGDAVIIDRS